jgi:RNA polymerase sigma factor (sigma-70 family)
VDLDSALRDLTPRILRYCRGYTGDACLAEEIAQDALIALVRHWRRQGPPDSIDAYVFAVARRRATRALARQRLLAPLEYLLDLRDRRPTPEAQVIARDERDLALSALRRLSHRERDALLLTAVADLGGGAAARTLGISESAFKMRVLRARRHLAAIMENGYGR